MKFLIANYPLKKRFLLIFIVTSILFFSQCQSYSITNPSKHTLVAIESSESVCSEVFRKKQFYLLFGVVPLNNIRLHEAFEIGNASYRISEKAIWSDILVTVLGAPTITLTSKTLLVEKCKPETIARFQKGIETNYKNQHIAQEEKHSKEILEKTEELRKEKEKFEKEKQSIVAKEVEKKKEDFEKEYALKREKALDEIVKKRLEEIELQKNANLKITEIKPKTEEAIRKELALEFSAQSEVFQKEFIARKDKELKKILEEKTGEIEKAYYKKKERESTIAIEKFLAKHGKEESSNMTLVYLKKGQIFRGKLIKFESDFVSIDVNGEIKRIFIREIIKVVLPKKS